MTEFEQFLAKHRDLMQVPVIDMQSEGRARALIDAGLQMSEHVQSITKRQKLQSILRFWAGAVSAAGSDYPCVMLRPFAGAVDEDGTSDGKRTACEERKTISHDLPSKQRLFRCNLSEDSEVLEVLCSTFEDFKNINLDSVDSDIFVQTNGIVGFSVEAYCAFCNRLAPKVDTIVQALGKPMELSGDNGLLEHIVVCLVNGGWIAYAIGDGDLRGEFTQWKKYTVSARLKKTISGKQPEEDTDAQVRQALQRLECFDVMSTLAFSFNQSLMRLSGDYRPYLGFGGLPYQSGVSGLIVCLPHADAAQKFDCLVDEMQMALLTQVNGSVSDEEFQEILSKARWLVDARLVDERFIDDARQAYEAGRSGKVLPFEEIRRKSTGA